MADAETYRIAFPADNDGFVSFQCAFCCYRFKLSAEELSATDAMVLYCPSCGLQDTPDSFITDDMKEYMEAFIKSIFAEKLNVMIDGFGREFRNSKYLTFEKGRKLDVNRPDLPTEPDDLNLLSSPCCGRSMKVDATSNIAGFYCPYCGVK